MLFTIVVAVKGKWRVRTYLTKTFDHNPFDPDWLDFTQDEEKVIQLLPEDLPWLRVTRDYIDTEFTDTGPNLRLCCTTVKPVASDTIERLKAIGYEPYRASLC
jgi:hypothetical protein